jgi:hypothetical protein
MMVNWRPNDRFMVWQEEPKTAVVVSDECASL